MSRDVKIFATDLDRDAVVQAGNGIYPESIAADLTPKMLGKYFYRKEDNYQIARHIREMVVFAQHNLVRDPPFTKIDLISCRNILIYLQPVLQKKVMDLFNFSLNPGGILFLGNSETIGDMSDCFETVHQKHKIYRCIGKQQTLKQPIEGVERSRKPPPLAFRESLSRFNRLESSNMMNRFMGVLENHFLPLSVIVNEQLDIIHIFGDAREYFRVPSGKTDFNIAKMAARDLAIPLATGIQRVFKSREDLTYANVKVTCRDTVKRIRLRIIPLPDKKDFEPLVAVFFEETPDMQPADIHATEVYDIEADVQQRIKDLEQELQFSNENLQATIEELETSNEELQATNEELLASNEELQSTNEELQSTNEELFTVNSEYQNKIIELTEMNNDVENLLTSSGIEILILDENGDIRKYSPLLTRLFAILDKDVGRPINHLSHAILDFDLIEAVRSVQKSNRPLSTKKRTQDGGWLRIRILPYYIGPNNYAGTILTFVDITEFERIKEALAQCSQVSGDMVRLVPCGVFVFEKNADGELVVESVNPRAEVSTGLEAGNLKGRRLTDFWFGSARPGMTSDILKVMETGKTCVSDAFSGGGEAGRNAIRIIAFPMPDNRVAVIVDGNMDTEKSEAASDR